MHCGPRRTGGSAVRPGMTSRTRRQQRRRTPHAGHRLRARDQAATSGSSHTAPPRTCHRRPPAWPDPPRRSAVTTAPLSINALLPRSPVLSAHRLRIPVMPRTAYAPFGGISRFRASPQVIEAMGCRLHNWPSRERYCSPARRGRGWRCRAGFRGRGGRCRAARGGWRRRRGLLGRRLSRRRRRRLGGGRIGRCWCDHALKWRGRNRHNRRRQGGRGPAFRCGRRGPGCPGGGGRAASRGA